MASQTQNPTVARYNNKAVVVVDKVLQQDDNSALYISAGQSAIWNDYMVESHYEGDNHIYMMGITSPGGFQGNSVAFAKTASKTLIWIADWTASNIGGKPPIPNPESNDSNWQLLDDWYMPASITLMADGVTPLYRISGTYIYGCKNPSSTTINNICFGRPPWVQDTFDRTVPESLLTRSIIDTQGQNQPGFFVGSK